MGFLTKFLNPRNTRDMLLISKLSNSLMGHMRKRCGYCEMDMGTGDNFEVIAFVEHLEKEHTDMIEPDDLVRYRKLIKKVIR